MRSCSTRVWGYDYLGDGRLVDVHVRRLRRKIEDDPAHPRYVVTVRGLGYKLQRYPKFACHPSLQSGERDAGPRVVRLAVDEALLPVGEHLLAPLGEDWQVRSAEPSRGNAAKIAPTVPP